METTRTKSILQDHPTCTFSKSRTATDEGGSVENEVSSSSFGYETRLLEDTADRRNSDWDINDPDIQTKMEFYVSKRE